MNRRILWVTVLLGAVVAVRAVAEDGPDLRAILSERKHRLFTTRIVGMTAPPEPVRRLGDRGDAKLLQAVSHWLRVGKEYEHRLRPTIAEWRRRDLVFRTTSLADVLFLSFANGPAFNTSDLHTWTNIALATAASGDYKGGAEILDMIDEMIGGMRPTDIDDLSMIRRNQSDSAALWIQHADAQDDLQLLLESLPKAGGTVIASDIDSWRLDEQSWGEHTAAFFNRGLALEKLGLYGAAIENYRRSLAHSNDESWKAETIRRIHRISQPSRRQEWLEARTRLEASRDGNVRMLRSIVRLFPDHARAAAEKDLLAAWARGALVGSTGENTRDLAIARRIGAIRRESFADSLVADTVRMIDRSIRVNDTRRLENLARGFLLYEQGAAAATFEEAADAFEIAGSPMANVARYHAIVSRFNAVPVDRSLEELRQLHRKIPANHRVLQAMVDGTIGNCLAERGQFEAALDLYTRAKRVFEVLGEADSAASMRVSAAHMLVLMGHPSEAWLVRLPALRTADASGNAALVELVLRQTASDEMFNRREWIGEALYSSLLPMPPLYARPGSEFRGSRWRKPAALRSKKEMLAVLSDRSLPADVQNDLRVAQAISLYQRKPEQAEALLTESIAFAEATGRVAMLPYVYFYRASARCETARGHDVIRDRRVYEDAIGRCDPTREDDAIHDLTHALSLLEARRRDTVRRDLRGLWYRVADDLFPELMNLYWNRGDDGGFFAVGERRRSMVVPDGFSAWARAIETLNAEEIAKRLEPGVAVIVFTASPTAVPRSPLVTIIEKDRVGMRRLSMPTGNLYFRTRKLRLAIEEERQADVQSLAEELYALLIEPFAINSERIKRLVIVADHPLHDVPFAIFRDRRSGQYLIEQFELMRAASASAYAQAKDAALLPLQSVVAVGDPAFDRRAYPSFSSLPAARAEAIAIGRQYPQSRTLIGRNATLQNLAINAHTADVIHIAAHTTPSVEEHELLKLLLAPSRQHDSACSVAEVTNLALKKGSIVVVSGCRTGVSEEPGTLRDFAGSFLAAGARNVVASLWDIKDDPSRTFALLFHRALRRCGSAVTATREAQLAMLRSLDERVRTQHAWSAFQVYGVSH